MNRSHRIVISIFAVLCCAAAAVTLAPVIAGTQRKSSCILILALYMISMLVPLCRLSSARRAARWTALVPTAAAAILALNFRMYQNAQKLIYDSPQILGGIEADYVPGAENRLLFLAVFFVVTTLALSIALGQKQPGKTT